MGRPREFCLETALEKALEVFWRRGFEGASIVELTTAMGIAKPTLYAFYGNKEELFRKALDLYDRKHMGFMRDALQLPSSRAVAEAILFGTIRVTATDGENPPGCMSMNGALACSVAADPIKTETWRRRTIFEGDLAQRLERAQQDGDLPTESDAAALAAFVMAMMSGIAVQAAAGVPGASLRTTAAMAMAAWPAPSGPRLAALHKMNA